MRTRLNESQELSTWVDKQIVGTTKIKFRSLMKSIVSRKTTGVSIIVDHN